MSVFIQDIAVYYPEKVLTNKELALAFNTEEDLILKNTGIKKRYISAPYEIASDMAVKAAEKLFESKNINKNDIDFLIFCSECLDYIAPASSCIIQDRLQLSKNIGCIDIPYGCSGYIYGLGMAHALLESGMAKTILFLTSETSTKVIAASNFELRSIFSDIATANLLLTKDSKQHFVFGTDGSGHKNLLANYSGFRNAADCNRTTKSELLNGEMKMNGTEIFLFAAKTVPKLVQDVLSKHHCTLDEVDLFVFHQASYFLLEILRKKIKIPKEKFFCNIEQVGNSVSSTIPVALHQAEQQGVLKRGMKVLLAGFGIGYSWGGTIITY
ncbi:MAG: ketoacyl-ACP synthase III [Bacteroidetes bacterium]|nr:ketoacyl-ACP synthase III [Bacteroidota bacterium]